MSGNVEYRPSSISSFLSRLSTFKLATYANKPPALDAVAASKCGWVNDGKDRLLCGICNASWVVAGKDGMSRDAANALVEKQKASLVSAHKDGCPWKTRQCDGAYCVPIQALPSFWLASIYRIPLQSPTATIRDVKSNALALEALLQDVETKHPLVRQVRFCSMPNLTSPARPQTSCYLFNPPSSSILCHLTRCHRAHLRRISLKQPC